MCERDKHPLENGGVVEEPLLRTLQSRDAVICGKPIPWQLLIAGGKDCDPCQAFVILNLLY